jgi:hypothetical protein
MPRENRLVCPVVGNINVTSGGKGSRVSTMGNPDILFPLSGSILWRYPVRSIVCPLGVFSKLESIPDCNFGSESLNKSLISSRRYYLNKSAVSWRCRIPIIYNSYPLARTIGFSTISGFSDVDDPVSARVVIDIDSIRTGKEFFVSVYDLSRTYGCP